MNQNQEQLIPLTNVNITGYLLDNLGKITCEFAFEGIKAHTINPIHYFSLDSNSTICDFSMVVGSTIYRGEVQEKSQAKQTYTKAQSEQKKTALIEKISPSDYKVSVGNVEPSQKVIVSFDYVVALEMDEQYRYVFSIPTNISIKYNGNNLILPNSSSNLTSEYENITYSTDANYNFTFDIFWQSTNNFLSFETNTNAIKVTPIDNDGSKLHWVANTKPENQDFKLYVKTDFKPSIYTWIDPMTFQDSNPTGYILSNIKIPNSLSASNTSNLSNVKNYQFILDRSGSMEGERISNARKALEIFVKKLPENSYFNIIGFGDTYKAEYSHSIIANNITKSKCYERIQTFDADMGRTEILQCLCDCVDGNLKHYESRTFESSSSVENSMENIIVILTDGDVGNINQIFTTIKSKTNAKTNTRIFTIGLGSGASKQFIKGISDLTYGDYFMVGDHENLDVPINKIMEVINKQYYTNIQIKNNNLDTQTHLNAIYPGKTYSLVIKTTQEQINYFISNPFEIIGWDPINLTNICWKIDTTQLELNETHFDYSIIKKIYAGECIKKMTTQLDYDILDYSTKTNLTNQIIKLSIEANIMNDYTSFVLVDKTNDYANLSPEVGIDLVVPHNSSTIQSMMRSIPISTVMGSKKNCTMDLRDEFLNPHAFSRMNVNSVLFSSNPVAPTACASVFHDDTVDALDGGMDMFGGSEKYCTFDSKINLLALKKLYDKSNGSYRFENDSWKLLCYTSINDFDSDCTKSGLTRVIFYNFIILLELIKLHKPERVKLMEYFETKYPRLFNSKKKLIENLYSQYIQNKIKSHTFNCGGGDY